MPIRPIVVIIIIVIVIVIVIIIIIIIIIVIIIIIIIIIVMWLPSKGYLSNIIILCPVQVRSGLCPSSSSAPDFLWKAK